MGKRKTGAAKTAASAAASEHLHLQVS